MGKEKAEPGTQYAYSLSLGSVDTKDTRLSLNTGTKKPHRKVRNVQAQSRSLCYKEDVPINASH